MTATIGKEVKALLKVSIKEIKYETLTSPVRADDPWEMVEKDGSTKAIQDGKYRIKKKSYHEALNQLNFETLLNLTSIGITSQLQACDSSLSPELLELVNHLVIEDASTFSFELENTILDEHNQKQQEEMKKKSKKPKKKKRTPKE